MAYFQELTYNKKLVKTWAYKTIDQHNHYRLYYQRKEEDLGGFHFVLVIFDGCDASAEDYWTHPSLEVEASCYGEAYFDGLRHVYTNSTEESNLDQISPDGYNYIVNAKIMERVFKELAALEEAYCSDIAQIDLV